MSSITHILFDIGNVLVKIESIDLILKYSRIPLTNEYVRNTWQSIRSVQEFELGKCDDVGFAKSVIHFYELNLCIDDFIYYYAQSVKDKFLGVDSLLNELKNNVTIQRK